MAKYLTDRNVAKYRLKELLDAQYNGIGPGCVDASHIVELERTGYIQVYLPDRYEWAWCWKMYNRCIYIPCILDSFKIKLKDDGKQKYKHRFR